MYLHMIGRIMGLQPVRGLLSISVGRSRVDVCCVLSLDAPRLVLISGLDDTCCWSAPLKFAGTAATSRMATLHVVPDGDRNLPPPVQGRGQDLLPAGVLKYTPLSP